MMDSAEDWVSITEAATRLSAAGDSVDRSSLSRYVKQYGDSLETRPDGRQSLVEFGVLKAHRLENIRLRPSAAAQRSGGSSRRVPGSQGDAQTRKLNADAEMREMDLAKRRGQLTITAEVGQAASDAVALMKSAFDRAIETTAATAGARHGWDERKMRLELKAFMSTGLQAFNSAILKRLDARERARMADELEDGTAVDRAGAIQ